MGRDDLEPFAIEGLVSDGENTALGCTVTAPEEKRAEITALYEKQMEIFSWLSQSV